MKLVPMPLRRARSIRDGVSMLSAISMGMFARPSRKNGRKRGTNSSIALMNRERAARELILSCDCIELSFATGCSGNDPVR